MNPISPTRFIVEVAGLSLEGDRTADVDGRCSFCAGIIHVGEPVCDTGAELNESFNNKLDIAIPTAPMVCGACTALRNKTWQQNLSKSVVTRGGVFKIASNAHQAHFILNPPPRPFVAFVSDGKMQHLTWRAAVTYGDDLMFMRMGDRQLSWSKANVERALDAVAVLRKLMERASLKGPHPFVRLDRELASAVGAQLRADVIAAAEDDAEAKQAISVIQNLTLGELWALTILVITPTENIVAPPVVKSLSEEV